MMPPVYLLCQTTSGPEGVDRKNEPLQVGGAVSLQLHPFHTHAHGDASEASREVYKMIFVLIPLTLGF